MRKTMLRGFNSLLASASFAAALLPAPIAHAEQTIYAAPQQEIVRVDRWGVCRDIRGASENPVMIPTGSPSEWIPQGRDSFLAAGAKGTVVTRCMSHISAVAGSWCSKNPGGIISFATTSNNGSSASVTLSPSGAYYIEFDDGNGSFGRTGMLDANAKRKIRSISSYTNFGPGSQIIYGTLRSLPWPGVKATLDLHLSDIDPASGSLSAGPTLLYSDNQKDTAIEDFVMSTSANHVALVRSRSKSSGWFSYTILSRDLIIYARGASGFSEVQTIPLPAGTTPPTVTMSSDDAEILIHDGDASPARSTSYLLDTGSGQYVLDRTYTAAGATPIPMKMAPGGTVAIGLSNSHLAVYEKDEPTESWALTHDHAISYSGSVDLSTVSLLAEGNGANFPGLNSNRVLRLTDLCALPAASSYALTGTVNGNSNYPGTRRVTFSFTSGSAGGSTVINTRSYSDQFASAPAQASFSGTRNSSGDRPASTWSTSQFGRRPRPVNVSAWLSGFL